MLKHTPNCRRPPEAEHVFPEMLSAVRAVCLGAFKSERRTFVVAERIPLWRDVSTNLSFPRS
jgi:hypothetical protein